MINCVTQNRPTIKRLSILESRARKLQKIVHTTIMIYYMRAQHEEAIAYVCEIFNSIFRKFPSR